MTQETVSVTRVDANGMTFPGTVVLERDGRALIGAGDPVDLDGEPMDCPPGSRIVMHLSSLHHATGEVPVVRD